MTNRSALNSVIDLLSRRSYSQQQLLLKLQQKGYPESEIADALEYALQNAWLDDRNYAMQLVRSRLERGYGRNYLQQYLMAKGIKKDIASEVLALPDWDWYQSLCLSFERKYKQGLPNERSLQQKCTAYLYRRGFEFDLINILYSELKHQ
ncbi:recombination regulator RecX [Agarivorans sp. TSD2052]|uniref:regulatory protein RecX n=1 Tax=Agarivorans sp. TSD2052 TaxID=2937286 RepID=UPI00200CCBD7|nr:regulatory protein RecX [Agarivorans sp. TSD2052]UPW17407.1 recombination regulator RecX [Agarivorans sp. TSD2052]